MAQSIAMNVAVDRPLVLLGALVLAAFAAVAVWLERRRRQRRLERLGAPSLLLRLIPEAVLNARIGRRATWLAIAGALAGVALAGPRWGRARGTAETQGIDIVFAVDASLSMRATDEMPDRLERAKYEARRIRALSRGDRVGLIAFAGRSYILTPLTSDDGALALFLDNIDPSIVGQPGSSLASAIRQGVDLLGPASSGDRALVVFTDGEAFDERADILSAARKARDAGVALVAVGFGTDDGSTIPVRVGENAIAPKRDADGHIVTSRYGRQLMTEMAGAAGGIVIHPEATDKASRVRAALAELRTERRRVQARQAIPLRYQWFLAPALVLLLWDIYAARRIPRRKVGASPQALTSSAATIALVAGAACLLAPRASAQQARFLREAQQHAIEQRPLLAARAWRRAIEVGDRHPQTLFNLGTAYLLADSLDSAIEVLERAATMPVGALHHDALFNLGLAYLRRGLATRGDAAATSLRGAMRAYRSVLLAAPDDADARWNYELAVRRLQEASSSPSGGGGGRGNAGNGEQPTSLAQEQAAQILDAAAREERASQERTQRPARTTATRGPDW
jgi:Ca-activated chloride channel family protein